MSAPVPRFAHDCDACVFLGRKAERDVYVCEQAGHPTIIERFGDDGPDYESGSFLYARLTLRLRERVPVGLRKGLAARAGGTP